jgi:2'-5' RNA ligase
MRVFIALKTSEEVKTELKQLQTRLKGIVDGVRWVRPDGIHITLKFLGEIEEKGLPCIYNAVSKAIEEIPPFTVLFDGMGGFPDIVAPRVIWVGVRGGEEIERIAKRVEEELHLIGYPKEKKGFTPHLTIGRIKRPRKDEALRRFLSTYNLPSLKMRVRDVSVMQSHLTPQGAVYTTLKEFRLGGGDESGKG